MKRILLVILIIACSAGIALKLRPPGPQAPKLIVVHHWNLEEVEFYRPIIENFEKEYGVKVELWEVPFGSEVDKVSALAQAGKKFDVIRMDIAKPIDMWRYGYLAPLNEIVGKGTEELLGDFLGIAADMDIFENKVYALPETIDCAVVFYNKKYFEKYGVPLPKENWTFQEFVETARKLTHPEDGIWGYGQRNSLWWDAPWIYSWGGTITDNNVPPTSCTLYSAETIAALENQIALIREGISPRDFDAETGFYLTKKFSMVLWGPWGKRLVLNAGIDLGVAPIPKGPVGSFSLIGGQHLGIYRESENKRLAYEFIKYLLRKEIQLLRFDTLGIIPTNREAYEIVSSPEYRKDPLSEVVLKQLSTARPRLKIPLYAAMEKLYIDQMELARKGFKSTSEALFEAQTRINREIFGK
jgi:multiple sugar transport system substrate-binding protein